MSEQRAVVVTREFDASPQMVFQALTHPFELASWFSHYAWTEPREGGDFQVRWRNGWWARGVYRMVERPWRVELTWQGKDEPGETTLVFQLRAVEHGTEVELIHGGYGSDMLWDKALAEAEGSWPLALENLESVLTTGIDLRQAHRPMIGIVPGVLTAANAATEHIGATGGLSIATVVEGGGAAEAGLRRRDVITSIDGMAVSDWESLTMCLAPYRAGERVRVSYVRGGRRATAVVELKPSPMDPISFNPQQVVNQARARQGAVLADLRRILAGSSEDDAEQKPSSGEWSAKETLAHLSLAFRSAQRWFADVIVGTTVGQSGGNPTTAPEALAMTLAAAPTVESLLDRLERDMDETLTLFHSLRPEIVAMKARYHVMASALLDDFHIRDHLQQVASAIEATKRQD